MNTMFVWTIGDLGGLVVGTIAVLWCVIDKMITHFSQKRCKHTSYFQTRQCDAICNACHKNLGSVAWLRHQEEKAKTK